jgi:hypothetical protein
MKARKSKIGSPEFIAALEALVTSLYDPFVARCQVLGMPRVVCRPATVMSALFLMGIDCRVAAGSAKWSVMSLDEQGEAMLEGKEPIPFFGYKFDLLSGIQSLMKGDFSDIHAWVVDMAGNIYDLSGAEQLQMFEELGHGPWPARSALPTVMIGKPDELKVNGWFYREDTAASFLLLKMCMESMPPT